MQVGAIVGLQWPSNLRIKYETDACHFFNFSAERLFNRVNFLSTRVIVKKGVLGGLD
jgi:hypothetical protein